MANTALGNYLKELRRQHGYTQDFLAKQLNVIRQTYSHYETGRISAPLDVLVSLSKFYEIPLQNFIDHFAQDADFELPIQYMHDSDTTSALASEPLYTATPENEQEEKLLNLFRLLDTRDKEEIMDFVRIKYKRKKNAR